MRIGNDDELAAAVREYDALKDAKDGSPEAKRRDDLHAAIADYYQRNQASMNPGKPAGSIE